MRCIMKKLLIFLVLIMPIIAFAQQKAIQSLTFCGVPFGIPTEEFKQKVDAQKTDDGKLSAWGFDEINYNVNLYTGADIAYSVEVRFGSSEQYKGAFAENNLLGSMCAKYGEFQEYRNRDNDLRKVWFLKNGLITMSYSNIQGKTSYVITIIDYAAIKKAGSTLQQIL